MELEVGDVVLCTVDRIEKTIVFVKLDNFNNIEGSIVMSEIAPGRIRNVRDYVVPKKKIVCKVLRISGDRIDLSLRRVSQKETKEVMDHYKQERSYKSIFKSVIGDKSEKLVKDILKEQRLYDFIEEVKQNPKALEKFTSKKDAEKILEILNAQKTKKATLKKEFSLKTTASDGLNLIKELLKTKEAEIKYVSAGKYTIKAEADDIKKADNKIKEILNNIAEKAKKKDMIFNVKEK